MHLKTLLLYTIILSGILYTNSYSQVTIEEETEDVDIDVSGTTGNKQSPIIPILLSAIIPGSGEKYLGQKKISSCFFLGEAIIWSSFFISKSYSNRAYEDAKSFAYLHAGARNGIEEKDMKYYENLADFINIGEYNRLHEINRDASKIYPVNDNWAWNWDNRNNFATYDNMMRDYRKWEMTGSFLVGTMIANRFLSVIDVISISKKYKVKGIKLNSTPNNVTLSFSF